MKIMYFKGKYPNFGDDLNPWMWPKIMPDFFDEDGRDLFIGTGSIIGEKYDDKAKKIVFGAGYVRQYHDMPDIRKGDWDVYFVRGPRTAQMLGLSPELSVGDSGIMLRTIVDMKRKKPEVVSFMPHWESLDVGNWEEVCRIAGINLIDPRRPVEDVISELLRSRVVIAEAMHGAIISDAFRIPWVPLLPLNGKHREKWFDWADALKIDLRHIRLWPSTLAEAGIAFSGRPALAKVVGAVSASPLGGLADKAAVHLAAQRLSQLAKASPCLSADKEMERVTEIMQQKTVDLRRNFKGG